MAAALLRLNVDHLRQPENAFFGHLLETFVVGEFAKQQSWSAADLGLSHWRDRDGREVDIVVELPGGGVVAIEVKSGRDVLDADLRHLEYFRELLGPRFVHGLVLYLGETVSAVGDRLTAAPLSALWMVKAPR